MNTSDLFSAIALIISLVSFCLTYRSAKLTKSLSAAEKRTQAHSILLECSIKMESLQSQVLNAITYGSYEHPFLDRWKSIEAKLSNQINEVSLRLQWLRENNSDDVLELEKYRSHALEVESLVNSIAPMILELTAEKKIRS
ncbi:MAG: hypothetical protein COB62_03760 [Piscirickettsiaceae bacterium]|nr:MAG: hypothetical protein COB62_03760 [Piscirickettsiaceae bacterium]